MKVYHSCGEIFSDSGYMFLACFSIVLQVEGSICFVQKRAQFSEGLI